MAPECFHECIPQYFANSYKRDRHRAKRVYSTGGATNIAKEVALNGPVATTFKVFEDFYNYESGIY